MRNALFLQPCMQVLLGSTVPAKSACIKQLCNIVTVNILTLLRFKISSKYQGRQKIKYIKYGYRNLFVDT